MAPLPVRGLLVSLAQPRRRARASPRRVSERPSRPDPPCLPGASVAPIIKGSVRPSTPLLGGRSTVGHHALDVVIGVRIPASQPTILFSTSRSCRAFGRLQYFSTRGFGRLSIPAAERVSINAAGLRCEYRWVIVRSWWPTSSCTPPHRRPSHHQVRAERVTQDVNAGRHIRPVGRVTNARPGALPVIGFPIIQAQHAWTAKVTAASVGRRLHVRSSREPDLAALRARQLAAPIRMANADLSPFKVDIVPFQRDDDLTGSHPTFAASKAIKCVRESIDCAATSNRSYAPKS